MTTIFYTSEEDCSNESVKVARQEKNDFSFHNQIKV